MIKTLLVDETGTFTKIRSLLVNGKIVRKVGETLNIYLKIILLYYLFYFILLFLYFHFFF